MFTLLEALYNLLSHITEEHHDQVPAELRDVLNECCDKLGRWLDMAKGE